MNDIQLKYADHCIDKIFAAYPKSDSLSNFFNGSRFDAYEFVISILKRDSFIERVGTQYKMTDYGHETIETHGSYSNFINQKNIRQLVSEQKEQLDTELKKLQKESLEYQETIRDKEEIIRSLEIKLKRIELIKQYRWFIGFILTVCTILGALLDRIWQMLWP